MATREVIQRRGGEKCFSDYLSVQQQGAGKVSQRFYSIFT